MAPGVHIGAPLYCVIRLLASAIVNLVASAFALVVAAQLLDDMSLDAEGFGVAVLVFVGAGILAEPLLRQAALKRSPTLLGSTALLSTLVSLVVTTLATEGLRISGVVTWLLAAVSVWVLALVARLVLPFLIFKRVLGGPTRGAPPD